MPRCEEAIHTGDAERAVNDPKSARSPICIVRNSCTRMQDASRRGEASCEQGLRGLAVGIIALSHAADAFLQPQFMLGFGQGGIRLLFMLEGLASSRLHAQPGSQSTAVPQLRRLLELVPLYVVLTFLYRPPAGADLLHAMFHGIDHLWAGGNSRGWPR